MKSTAPSRIQNAADDSALLERFLLNRDIGCPRCGYNLRDLARRTCPECGAPLTLHVGSPRFSLGAWLIALIAVCIPLGFALTMSALAAYSAIVRDLWLRTDAGAVVVLAIADVILAAAFGMLIARREEWLAQPPAIRRVRASAWAAAGALFTVALVAILSATLE